MMPALVSIHDVMPETLERVERLLALMSAPVRRGTVLLVVPGRDWQPDQVAQLARWQGEGLELAGHGWTHRAERIQGWYHRCHSRWVSRHAAEHLSQPRGALCELLERNYRWFIGRQLRPPSLYVPPAWALGALTADDLKASPFSYLETTRGLWHLPSGRRRALPLVGFEADTSAGAVLLRTWNRVNAAWASPKRPLRLAIHPYDDELLLAGSLREWLARISDPVDYWTLFDATSARFTES
ncbi:polysaccharide deacetylase family protein [Marinimicrobium agarilyticum]|uniref:polysaccharide deacetylase family protein n=1 Tax=Marinimicrobium agarilyticum TaxID=306546 RepID=UPI0004271C63|nr:polysaccharide deacetylase family protein [Marinimicrobium agarilyticum]